jgi:hypothetical protein
MLGNGVSATLARVTTFHCPDARNSLPTNYWNRPPARASVASPRRTVTPDHPGRRAGARRGGGPGKRRRIARGQRWRNEYGVRLHARLNRVSGDNGAYRGMALVVVRRWNSSQNVRRCASWVTGLADFAVCPFALPACPGDGEKLRGGYGPFKELLFSPFCHPFRLLPVLFLLTSASCFPSLPISQRPSICPGNFFCQLACNRCNPLLIRLFWLRLPQLPFPLHPVIRILIAVSKPLGVGSTPQISREKRKITWSVGRNGMDIANPNAAH